MINFVRDQDDVDLISISTFRDAKAQTNVNRKTGRPEEEMKCVHIVSVGGE